MSLHVLFCNVYLGTLSRTSFHTGIAALSAYIKRGGHKVSLISVNRQEEIEAALEKAVEIAPDLVAFSVSTSEWPNVKRMASEFKKIMPKTPIVCGGYHVTLMPDEVLSTPEIDMICLGEGEEAFGEMLEQLERGGSCRDIKNFWVKEKSWFKKRLYKNPLRPLPQDLDILPFWDREIFISDGAMEVSDFCALGGMPVGAGRGCPYSCTFCNNSTYLKEFKGLGKYVRKRSPSNIISEMQMLVTNGMGEKFELWDELFATKRDWVEEFCYLYKEQINRPYAVLLRVDEAKDWLLDMLYDSGCRLLLLGVEVGNEDYRRKILKKRFSNAEAFRVFDRCREMGMDTFAFFMFGLPGEDTEMMEESINFAQRLRPTYFAPQIFYPLVGTELYDLALEKGMLPQDFVKDPVSMGWKEKSSVQPLPGIDYYVPLVNGARFSVEEMSRINTRMMNLAEEMNSAFRKNF